MQGKCSLYRCSVGNIQLCLVQPNSFRNLSASLIPSANQRTFPNEILCVLHSSPAFGQKVEQTLGSHIQLLSLGKGVWKNHSRSKQCGNRGLQYVANRGKIFMFVIFIPVPSRELMNIVKFQGRIYIL